MLVVLETIASLESIQSQPPVSASIYLEMAAVDHVKDIGANNIDGHDGSDNSKIKDRIERYCAWKGAMGENIVRDWTVVILLPYSFCLDCSISGKKTMS